MFVGQNEILNLQVAPEFLPDSIVSHSSVIFPMAFLLPPEQRGSLPRILNFQLGRSGCLDTLTRDGSGDD